MRDVKYDLNAHILTLAVPDEFMYNPVTRSYGEPHKRPEVQNSTVEFIASSDYMVSIHPSRSSLPSVHLHAGLHQTHVRLQMLTG